MLIRLWKKKEGGGGREGQEWRERILAGGGRESPILSVGAHGCEHFQEKKKPKGHSKFTVNIREIVSYCNRERGELGDAELLREKGP